MAKVQLFALDRALVDGVEPRLMRIAKGPQQAPQRTTKTFLRASKKQADRGGENAGCGKKMPSHADLSTRTKPPETNE